MTIARVLAATLLAALASPALSGVAPAADIPGNAGTRAVLRTGSTGVGGVFEARADADWFRVTLRGGQNYAVTGAGSSPDFGACVTVAVRDARGRLLRSAPGGFGSDTGLEFRPTRSGTFIAEFRDCSTGGQPLNYRGRVTADARGDPSTAATVRVGQTIRGIANWGVDRDYFRATLDHARAYTVSADAGNTVEVVLADARGRVLFSADGSGGATLRGVSVPASGTYYVGAAGTDDFGGSYTLTLSTP